MAITFGDYLIDSGYHDITPEQEREIEAREECVRRGLNPDDDAADGVLVWMVVDYVVRRLRRDDDGIAIMKWTQEKIEEVRSPDDDREPEECYHEEFDIDWEGRAHCDQCGHSWWATADEIRAQSEHEAEYAAWVARQERREFWRKLTFSIRWPIFQLLKRIWPRKSINVLYDDEVPF